MDAWKGRHEPKRHGRQRIRGLTFVGLAAAICVAALLVLVSVATTSLNEAARESEKSLLTSIVDEMRLREQTYIEALISSATLADAVARRDIDQLNMHFAARFVDTPRTRNIYILDPDGKPLLARFGRVIGDAAYFDILAPALNPVAQRVFSDPRMQSIGAGGADSVLSTGVAPIKSAILDLYGHSTIVFVAPIIGDVLGRRADGKTALIIVTSRIRDSLVREVRARFGFKELRLSATPASGRKEENVQLPVLSGSASLFLVWEPQRPGDVHARWSLSAALVAVALVLFLIQTANRRIASLVNELQSRETIARTTAREDRLTGLPNRLALDEFVAKISQESSGSPQYVMHLIDLDRFKFVNDAHGHVVGDELIRSAAERVSQCCGPNDLVARLGGDEFAVVQRITGPDDAARMAQAMHSALLAPYEIIGIVAHIGASIGTAAFVDDSHDLTEIMRRADIAMYESKHSGGGVTLFDEKMGRDLRERQRLENDLRAAVAERSMWMAFQPQVSADGASVIGCEALLRWTHPELGAIERDVFIPMAEEIGLIDELTRFALDRACAAVAHWPTLKVAVNISALQLQHKGLLADVSAALAHHNIPPQRLELELTESALAENIALAEQVMADLKGLGVSLALDDFGTGYSSLAHLQRFKLDKIKIDKSFIKELSVSSDAAMIVHSVINLGRALGMKVVAEGVETPDQQRFLHAAGCSGLQGYLFGVPEPFAVADRRFRALKQPALPLHAA
jgi:diguanylate cyclase (GGDEF)-like protein